MRGDFFVGEGESMRKGRAGSALRGGIFVRPELRTASLDIAVRILGILGVLFRVVMADSEAMEWRAGCVFCEGISFPPWLMDSPIAISLPMSVCIVEMALLLTDDS